MRRGPLPLLLAEPTRFAGLPRRTAIAVLATVSILILAALLALAAPLSVASPAPGGGSAVTDLQLYGAIVEAMHHGERYYPAAADALRAGGYPLQPFVAVRLPTLAAVLAAVPPALIAPMLWSLVLAVLLAWGRRLAPAFPKKPGQAVAAVLMLGGTVAFWRAELAPFHELWAGLLIALSLAIRTPGRWVEAAALGLAAALIRETAAPYLLVMGTLALAEGHRREAVGWAAALGVFALVLAVHAHAVAGVVRPLDPVSPGWSGLLGFGFFARALVTGTALSVLPLAVGAPLVALALVGWAGWRGPLALRMLATLATYAALIGLFARADTFYWVMLVAPASLVGLALAPDALRDLLVAALDKRRITVRRVVR